MAFDKSYSRLITAEADKTIKMYREDPDSVSDGMGALVDCCFMSVLFPLRLTRPRFLFLFLSVTDGGNPSTRLETSDDEQIALLDGNHARGAPTRCALVPSLIKGPPFAGFTLIKKHNQQGQGRVAYSAGYPGYSAASSFQSSDACVEKGREAAGLEAPSQPTSVLGRGFQRVKTHS